MKQSTRRRRFQRESKFRAESGIQSTSKLSPSSEPLPAGRAPSGMSWRWREIHVATVGFFAGTVPWRFPLAELIHDIFFRRHLIVRYSVVSPLRPQSPVKVLESNSVIFPYKPHRPIRSHERKRTRHHDEAIGIRKALHQVDTRTGIGKITGGFVQLPRFPTSWRRIVSGPISVSSV